MKTSGQLAEAKAVEYLESNGYTILAKNWRTKVCEIDIVASQSALHFIEVKYRRTNRTGAGLDYITATKLRKMKFAAQQWLNANHWRGEVCLGVIEVSGNDYNVTEFIDQLDQ